MGSSQVSVSMSASAAGHRPVLRDETIAALQPRAGGRYIDGTFGGGGHTRELLAASAPDGIVLALDADPAAIVRAEALRAGSELGARLIPVQSNFAELAVVAQ
jgi:16S rRNA (cytosine1402-N4)-methyltransferase